MPDVMTDAERLTALHERLEDIKESHKEVMDKNGFIRIAADIFTDLEWLLNKVRRINKERVETAKLHVAELDNYRQRYQEAMKALTADRQQFERDKANWEERITQPVFEEEPAAVTPADVREANEEAALADLSSGG